jgi:hypothetical protein
MGKNLLIISSHGGSSRSSAHRYEIGGGLGEKKLARLFFATSRTGKTWKQ